MLKSTLVALLLTFGLSTTTVAFADDYQRADNEMLRLVVEYEDGSREFTTTDDGRVALTWRECRNMGGWKFGRTCRIKHKGVD